MTYQPSDFGGLCFSRIVIVGANGAGKTWLARRLSDAFDMPVISKDALALTTNWGQRPRCDVAADILATIPAPKWILEGGPSILSAPVLCRATLIIWLDLPAGLRFRRILWRSLRYVGRSRPEHPPGNRDWPGLRQWRFAWRALREGKRFSDAVSASLSSSNTPVVRLTDQRAVLAFLRGALPVWTSNMLADDRACL